MTKHIDYYFATISPWMFLGHDRFVALARAARRAPSRVKPVNLGEIFPVSGGLPLSKRAPQRQAYRLVELERWSEFLGMPMNIQPKFFPANGDLAACWITCRGRDGAGDALALTGAVGRALWERGARHRRRGDAGRARRRMRLDAADACARAPRLTCRRAMRASRRRRSSAAYSARRPTSSTANCSGDRTGSTSWPENWQNSVFSPAGRASRPAVARGIFVRPDAARNRLPRAGRATGAHHEGVRANH